MKLLAFDSGVGGLTALGPLLQQRPDCEVQYIGDLANLPYGSKSPQKIQELAVASCSWLAKQHSTAKLLIVACNTVSAVALPQIELALKPWGIPVVGVLDAGCDAAMRATSRNSRIVILATASTVKSNAYRDALLQKGCTQQVVQVACPLFVPLVEEGLTDGPIALAVAHHYLASVLKAGDVVILGCTHYPFLQPLLQRSFPNCVWIDAGKSLLSSATLERLMRLEPKHDFVGKLQLHFTDATASANSIEQFLSRMGLPQLPRSLHFVTVHNNSSGKS
jgi:glutamate racemase